MQKLNKDIGSSFYQLQEGDWEFNVFQKNDTHANTSFSYYYSGRNAILAILKKVTSTKAIRTIWLPSYYCDTVINLVTTHFNNVAYYDVDPFNFETQVEFSSFCDKNDIIILNNFWGLSTFKYSKNAKNKPIVIEDHSHGWLSPQSINSEADFCMCSLRKTYPIPLGAVVWQPKSTNTLNIYEEVVDEAIIKAYSNINESMSLKRHFIKKGMESVKQDYLALLNKGESLLNHSNNCIKPHTGVIALIKKYIALDPNQIKNQNHQFVLKHLNDSQHFKVIHKKGNTPFGLLLLFSNQNQFNSFKSWLVSHSIYPAHLWPNTSLESKWKHLFNLHIDFRYNTEDMSYLVEKINDWNKNNV